jgi:hypothetical protein
MIDRSGSKKKTSATGNTFLGVRPGTITSSLPVINQEQVAERADIINQYLSKKKTFTGNTATGVRPGDASTKPRINNAALVKSATALDVIDNTARSFEERLNNFANNKGYNSNRSPYFYNGQFQNAAESAGLSFRKILPAYGDYTDLARFNAKRDTSTDPAVQQFYAEYGLDQTTHNYFIQQGNRWMTDDKALTDWILSDPETAPDKQGQYEEYMRKYLRPVNTYDPNDNRYKVEQQFTEDAPLPPWIPATVMNVRMWDYYKTYAHDVVQVMADRYVERSNEVREFNKNPYKSAFSSSKDEHDVDSFLDLFMTDVRTKGMEDPVATYFKEYYINPIKHGKFLTVAGNALWNLMDTMDFAARGVRAFVAGDTILGGARGSFKGQQEYWAQLPGYDEDQSKLLQEKFMKNGGYELLRLDHPDSFTGHITGSRDELIKQLDEAFGGRQNWDSIYRAISNSDYFDRDALDDVRQGVENVKQAYSDPSASFEADTGSTAANILIESVLDPGAVFGGMSKNLAKGTVRSAADNAVESGFRAILRDSNSAVDLLKDKRVKAAVKEFVNLNEGKHIIFKDSDQFNDGVEVLIKKLSRETNLFTTEASKETFRRTVASHLLGKQTSINGKIIASTDWARKAIDTKTFKAAYYMDKAIDGIDSAIVKSSFAAPWALVKGSKLLKDGITSLDSVQKYVAARQLARAEAARSIRDSISGAVDVTKASNLIRKLKAGEIDTKAAMEGLRTVVHQYDRLSVDINSWIPKVANGELTQDEVMKLVSDSVSNFTGGKYTRIADLSGDIAQLDIRYTQDLQNAFEHLNRTNYRLLDTIERLNNGVRKDLVQATITQKDIKKGIDAYKRTVSSVAERTLSVNDFRHILETEFPDFVKGFFKPEAGQPLYPNNLASILQPDESVTDFSLDYIKSQIDLAMFSIEGSLTRDPRFYTSSVPSLLDADPRIAELRAIRTRLQGLDLISLKDVEIVTTLHTDRMAMFEAFVNSPQIQKLYTKTYDTVIAPVMDTFISKFVDDADLASDSFFKDLLRIKELKYGFDRTNSLKAELSSIRGLSDKKLHTVLNGLGNNFGMPYGTLQDVVRTPGLLRKHLDVTARTQFGAPKLGMAGLTDMLKSVDSTQPSQYLQPFMKEFDDSVNGVELKNWFDSIANGNPLDPSAYTDKQMLSAILMDPSIVGEYNRLASEGNAPIFMHISTTGLSSEINDITAVSYRRWVPIEVTDDSPLTLEKIKSAFESKDSAGTFRRGLSDAEIDAISENNLRHLADWKGMDSSQIRAAYKELFGASDNNPLKGEDQLLEEVCSFINGASISSTDGLVSQVPHLVVHDADGFNIPFLNKKIINASRYSGSDSMIYDYTHRLSEQIQNASFNTYSRLAEQMGDYTFSSEEIDEVTHVLNEYIYDISRYAGDNYNITDFSEYHDVFKRIYSAAMDTGSTIDELQASTEDIFYDIKSQLRDALNTSDCLDDLIDYQKALINISDLSLRPKQFVFTSSGEVDNAVYAALKATGKDTINVESRIYVKDVLSYFDIARTDTGLNVSFDALNKMHNMAQYIIRNRDNAIASGASEFLEPYKAEFDALINSIVFKAHSAAYTGSEFEFLRNLKVPDTAVESYLMAQKLYDDYVKFWINEDRLDAFDNSAEAIDRLKAQLTNVKRSIENYEFNIRNSARFGYNEFKVELLKDELAELESRKGNLHDFIFQEACDHMNNYHRKTLNESLRTFGGGMVSSKGLSDNVLDILEGANRPDIFKTAANADYTKTVYSYRDGVLREGIEMATRVSEANSKIRSEMKQLSMIDAFYRSSGVRTSTDQATGMLFGKTKRLFDMLDSTGFTRRESFQTFIKRVSEIQHQKLQQYSFQMLKTDGKFDRNKLISELVWNEFNHVVYNSHAFTSNELKELKSFVADLQKKGDNFLSLYEDRSTGNIFIYLNNKAEIATDGTKRFINRAESFDKPVRQALNFSSLDELKEVIDLDDIEDFREVYDQLISCWEDTRALSRGSINGTSGRVVTRKQAEDYLGTLPSAMSDMLSPRGMLVSDSARGIVYDPGFVISEDSDILTDFLSTLSKQADQAKDDCIIINEVFGQGNGLQFKDLAEHFSDEELMQYFGNSSDYVVATIVEGKGTRTGLFVQRLKIDNLASLRAALELPNTTILPYDMYYETAEYMNAVPTDNVYKRLLGKYLWVYKAFALGTKPGTWVRNYIDATKKAALDSGEDLLSGTASLVSYHGKAIRDISTYYKIMKADPSLLNEANWNMVQKVFKTDMPYEDFEMLKGLIDSDRFVSADKYFMNNTASNRAGLDIISGDNVGIRNLDEADISKAFDKYLAKEVNMPFKKDEFLDIYFNRIETTPEMNEAYEGMMRRLSHNLRTANTTNIFDKTINNMFKPFALTEYATRYSQSLYLRDMGLSGNQTLRHIHQTQFYNAPSWGTFNKLETIMPFVTFKYNNIMYWIRMMDENPRYFRYFEDVYGNIADDTIENYFDQNQNIDYESDNMFQSGGIPAGVNNVYFNTGNSFLSAMNDFYGFTSNFRQLNPLLRETLRYSAYALGFNSKEFFSELDLDVSDENPEKSMLSMVPGYSLVTQADKTFKNIANTCTTNGGPTMDMLWSTLSFLSLVGVRKVYSNARGSDFSDWVEELEAQGKWYDFNTGKVVDISMKNDYGANNPNNSFEDVEAYMMLHFGKVWDANQHKFVLIDEYTAGGLNQHFDFENDPDAWEKLQEFMRKYKGKVYDYNLKKFVLEKDLSPGGLNDPNISWDKKCQLMDEKFGLKWDANQNAFVTPDRYIAGGLNQTFDMGTDRGAWSRLQSLRLALYGETYNKVTKHFEQTAEPTVVILSNAKEQREYDEYFSRLAIPRLRFTDERLMLNSEGLLVTADGKYVLTNNPEYNEIIFNKVSHLVSGGSRWRNYPRWKRYSFHKFTKFDKKPYKGRTLPQHYYTGIGWNDEEGYYRLNFNFNYQYHSPEPGRKLRRLLSPRINYPFGGGYNKYSFYTR